MADDRSTNTANMGTPPPIQSLLSAAVPNQEVPNLPTYSAPPQTAMAPPVPGSAPAGKPTSKLKSVLANFFSEFATNAGMSPEQNLQLQQMRMQAPLIAQQVQESKARAQLIQSQAQMVDVPGYGPMPAAFAKAIAPALIRAGSVDKTNATKEAIAQINARMKAAGIGQQLEFGDDGSVNVRNLSKDEMAPAVAANIAAKNAQADLAEGKRMQLGDMLAIAHQKADAATSNAQVAKDRLELARSLGGSPAIAKAGMASFDEALKADRRLEIMQDALTNPNGQNDVAMLFNHIGMTLSAQTGARITNAEIERAIRTRSLPQDLMARWDSVQSGKFLSPEQRQQMVDLAVKNRDVIWDVARRKAKMYGVGKEPQQSNNLPPLGGQTVNARPSGYSSGNPFAPKQ